jgi:tripartite-type tricarboxylate transporter receptor subunit TctC
MLTHAPRRFATGWRVAWSALFLFAVIGEHVGAQPASESFPPRTVQLVVSFGAGGGYDLWARAVARHMSKYLPGNPAIVVQNMPGAGGFTATSYLYNIAPNDGSVIGLVAREAVLGPLTGASGARFDATKFSYLGSPTTETSICIVNAASLAGKSADHAEKPLSIGDTGSGSGTYAYSRGLARLLGFNFKFVSGFPSTADVFLAMERNEVDGVCEGLDSIKSRRSDWISSGKVAVLSQSSREPNPDIKNVPTVYSLARTEEDRQALRFLYAGQDIGRPFLAPPNMAPGRLKVLREAFDATMRDPDFIADAGQQKLPVDPLEGAQLQSLIGQIYATPKSVIDKVGGLIR